MKGIMLLLCAVMVITGTSGIPSVTTANTATTPVTSSIKSVPNDYSYFLCMTEKLLLNLLNTNTGRVIHEEIVAPYGDRYIIDDAIAIGVESDAVGKISIDYTKLSDPTAAALMGINGNDTFDTFIERFGAENCYPTSNSYCNESSPPLTPEQRLRCSVFYMGNHLGEDLTMITYDGPALSAGFDKNGKMLWLHMSVGV